IFDSPWIAVSCWVHYIVGDLFVGAWISRDALRRDLSYPFLAAPAILGALLFMPAGLSFYLIVRAIRTKAWRLGEQTLV
ncbi:MAG: DUF4281 domain-containing protein, partial [Polyangiaceae bacterium]|nr:DUF4281 domain-containing protein [Polyangiaceae bacterium]